MRFCYLYASILSIVVTSLSAAGCKDKPTSEPPFPEAQWAYARVITDDADLIGGPLAAGEQGDLLIGNARVRFLIQGLDNPRAYTPYGGSLIDADIVRPAGEPGQDHLGELAGIAGYVRFVAADSIEVVCDGSGGLPAVVRVTGPDGGMPLVDSMLPLEPSKLQVQVDYILEPEAESITIQATYTAVGEGSSLLKPGDGLVVGDLVTVCGAPEPGCENDASGKSDLVGAYSPGRVSYGYFLANDTTRIELAVDELFLMMGTGASLPPGESHTYTRYLAVGDGDMTSIHAEHLRRNGLAEPRLVEGRVELTTGAPAVGAAVDVHLADGDWITRAVADDSGTFQIALAPGSYAVTALLPMRPRADAQTVDVTSGDASGLVLTLDPPAQVQLDIRDDQGQPLPARVSFLPGTNPSLGVGAVLEHHTVSGGGLVTVPAGDYVAAVTRGYEYDYDWVPVAAVAGQTVTLEASLAHVVDTTGYLALDSHTHTRWSIDSQLSEEDRVAQAAAEHVEVVVTTEHDYVFDIAPTITAEGADDHVHAARGIEISPLYGHTNAYPVTTEHAHRQGYWPLFWWSTDANGEVTGMNEPTTLFADARDALGAQIIQLNHPREGQGVLNHVGYDPAVGFGGADGVEPEVMDTSFNAVEICNSGWDDSDQEALQDWYSFLNQGLPIVAVGVSDSHGLGTMLGICRTLVAAPDDEISADLDLQPVWDNLLAQRATMVNGPFVLIWATDDASALSGIGDLATRTTAGPIPLRVQVQAAPFVHTARLIIVANGQPVHQIDLPDPGDPPAVVRFDDTILIDWTGGDAWFVAVVEGDQPMHPLTSKIPRSVTNPVYVDRDGNGTWTPPGL
jgi:hypothetical protein